MKRSFIMFGVVNGFLAVALGAFGAHGLEGSLTDAMIAVWEKAVTYQMFHTTALLATGILFLKMRSKTLIVAGWSFLIGIILFSGSLYIYSTTGIKALAMITPFGGVVFLVGWILLGVATMKGLPKE